MSAGGVKSIGATAKREAGAGARGGAGLTVSGLPAAALPGAGLPGTGFPGAMSGRGFGSGTVVPASACTASKKVPAAAAAAMRAMDALRVKLSSQVLVVAMLFVRED